MSLDRISQLTPQRWQQIKAVLCDALEYEDKAEREAFLANACAGDADLRHEVESFLEPSADNVEAFADNLRSTLGRRIWSEPLGCRFGAYKIVGEIGRGGMGSVYLAERADGQFEKQVAIKLLKRGNDTDEIVRRFRSERQILAQLEHPCIARLLDAGTTEDGLPYFVMEYVAGVSITQFVKENHLPIPQRLQLFLKVCAAVERAHRDNIVHRDLKSSNILVTSEGQPKLLDFGIAKLLEPENGGLEVTATDQRRLTPICASPEQARGEPVTMATDVYALGALLYEMLTDKSPYKFSSTRPSSDELTHVICEEEPPPPSRAASDPKTARLLHGNLDNIVHRALRKEPEKRYPSVPDFAQDIKAYLTKQPIVARPPTTAYRVRRFLTRDKHDGLLVTLASASILIAAGVLLLVIPKWRHVPMAASPEDSPRSDKSIAVLPFDNFNNEKDDTYFVDGVQDDILTDLAKVSDLHVISRDAVLPYRDTGKKSPREIGRILGVAHVLEGSVQNSGDRVRVNARLTDTRTSRQEWAESYERKVDDLFSLQSELAQAIVAQLEARLSPTEKAAIERHPTNDVEAYDLFLQARGWLSQFAGKDGGNWKKAIDLADQAIARDPSFTLAYCLKSTAHILLYRYVEHTPQRLALAKDAAETALRLAPDLPNSHLALASYYYHGFRDYAHVQHELNLIAPTLRGKVEYLEMAALTERRLGHWKAAIRDGEKAVALNPRDPILATSLIETYLAVRDYPRANAIIDAAIAQLPPASTGSLWLHKGDIALAVGDLDKAQAVIEASPKTAHWQNFTSATIALYRRQYREALRLAKAALSDNPSEALYHLFDGQVEGLLGNSEKAREGFEKARTLLEAMLRERPADPLLSDYLAKVYAGLGKTDEALRLVKRAMESTPISSDSIEGVNCLESLAEVNAMKGDSDAAINTLSMIVGMPSGLSYGDLRFNPEWDSLRKDPRFVKILQRVATKAAFE